MKTIQITINCAENVATGLADLAARCTEFDAKNGGATTHGALSVEALLALLVEDAAMVITRPGSWEGDCMSQVLAAHGYQF